MSLYTTIIIQYFVVIVKRKLPMYLGERDNNIPSGGLRLPALALS